MTTPEPLSSTGRLAAIKARILEACRKVQGEGGRIGTGVYGVERGFSRPWVLGDEDDRCCPMGAVLLVEQPMSGAERNPDIAVANLLDVTPLEVDEFAGAFDGMAPDNTSEFATMAREIRKELGL